MNVFEDLKQNKGLFFITNHIGNIEVLQTLLMNEKTNPNFKINVFMSNLQSKIFNDFLKTIEVKIPVELMPVESIGLETGIILKEKLDKGETVFIAGDRLSENNSSKYIKGKIFEHYVKFPKGTFKLAELLEAPTYFITAVKENKNYKIYLEKQTDLTQKELINSYSKYLEKMIKLPPYQFYHFYDFFELPND